MDYVSETEKALETVLLQIGRDMFGIYQLKPGDDLRYHRWVSLSTLRSEGNNVKRENYTLVYTGNLENGQTLDNIYERFNLELPADFRGHPLSMSDIIVIKRDGHVTAHYVDKGFGFIPIPGFVAGPFDYYSPRNSVDFIHSTDVDDRAFYMVSNEEYWIVKVVDEAQLKLLYYCVYPMRLSKPVLARLLNDPHYRYYESVEAYVAYVDTESAEILGKHE